MQDDTDTNALHLAEDFPPVPAAVWEMAIQRDLQGADYEATLVWHSPEGIAIQPYYRSSDSTSAASSNHLVLRRARTGWEIVPSDVSGASSAGHSARADLVFEAGGDIVQQLGVALAQGVETLATMNESESGRPIRFVFAVGPDYFAEIAKLRAARLLWMRVVQEFHPNHADAFPMHLHVRTALTGDSQRNMLRATTEAMSAVIGGCDSLSIHPAGFAQQLAMNIQRVLAEEAHLRIVADPAAGSHYVEALTASFARAAWKLFQRIEAAGGYAAALKDGWLTAEIESSHKARGHAASSAQEQPR